MKLFTRFFALSALLTASIATVPAYAGGVYLNYGVTVDLGHVLSHAVTGHQRRHYRPRHNSYRNHSSHRPYRSNYRNHRPYQDYGYSSNNGHRDHGYRSQGYRSHGYSNNHGYRNNHGYGNKHYKKHYKKHRSHRRNHQVRASGYYYQ